MRVSATFLVLCALLLSGAGCGETPQPTDNAADSSPELGAESAVPPAPGGESESDPEESAQEPADTEGGPALPPAPTQ
jgi:hypothetical protein